MTGGYWSTDASAAVPEAAEVITAGVEKQADSSVNVVVGPATSVC